MGSCREMRARVKPEDRFDLIIIGGGITGCGVAREAAARGLKVLLLEQQDLAAGTSSRSTKLIHGGIRYLKQFDLRLVREGVRERQHLIQAAPHLVHPTPFLYPVHRGDPDPLFALRMGLWLYDWFAGRRNLLRHRNLPGPKAVLAEEPLLCAQGLLGGALYGDCLTDDARLTVAVARAAAQEDALVLTYTSVNRFLYDEMGKLCGVAAVDRMGTGAEQCYYANAVLNASGPWVDLLRQLDEPSCRPILRPTKGAHVTVRHQRLPLRHPVVMHAADGRLMFAVPREGLTYLGTTDTDYLSDPGAVQVESADVAYILTAANRLFPLTDLRAADVVSCWAGVRSLAAAREDAGPSEVSRDYRLHWSKSGLVSVAGGKLTAFAAMAQAILFRIFPNVTPRWVPMHLPGAEPDLTEAEAVELARRYRLTRGEVAELISRHGAESAAVLAGLEQDGVQWPGQERNGQEQNGALFSGRIRMLVAEAIFAVKHEFAATLGDVLNRRTSQLLFSLDNGLAAAPTVAMAMAELLGWDAAARRKELANYQKEVAAMMQWRQLSLEPLSKLD